MSPSNDASQRLPDRSASAPTSARRAMIDAVVREMSSARFSGICGASARVVYGLKFAGLVLQADEPLAKVAEIELRDLDLRFEQLEAAIAQVLDVGHRQIGFEQHAVAAGDLGFGFALSLGLGRALRR